MTDYPGYTPAPNDYKGPVLHIPSHMDPGGDLIPGQWLMPTPSNATNSSHVGYGGGFGCYASYGRGYH